MVRMPGTVKVGPHTYKILRKPAAAMTLNGEAANGFFLADRAEIWIYRGLNRAKRREFLLHELLHACVEPFFHTRKVCTEETFVRHCTPNLLGILQDNPKLVEFFTQK